ncbi:MAG: tRNA (adenosine(37)-N6)-threonylcarbamoyltransferase complex ATPase subunit type 1 TsaE [Chloroflexota bacterium]
MTCAPANTLISHDAASTTALGEALGRVARPGDVFLLIGDFGAGKTTFVQGLARGLGVAETVTSPSFVFAIEHPGRLPLFHLDLFRMGPALDDEMIDTLYEYAGRGGVSAIEWPQAVPPDVVENAAVLTFTWLDDNVREIRFERLPKHLASTFASQQAKN